MMHGQPSIKNLYKFNVHGFVHRNNILVYNSNKMHKSLSLFNLTIALHVSGITITHFRSTKQLQLQHLVTITPYCCLLLLCKSWN